MLESLTLSERRACAPQALSRAAYTRLRTRMAALCAEVFARDAESKASYETPYASGKSRVDTVLDFGGRRSHRQPSRLWYWTLSAMMSLVEGGGGQL